MYLTLYKLLSWAGQAITYAYVGSGSDNVKPTHYFIIYIFMDFVSDLFKPIIFTVVIICIAFVSFGFTICLIQGISFLSVPVFAISIPLLYGFTVLLSITKNVYVYSCCLLHNMKSESENLVLWKKKTILSLRKCRVYCASQYFIDSGFVCNTLYAIVNYTISNVLMLK